MSTTAVAAIPKEPVSAGVAASSPQSQAKRVNSCAKPIIAFIVALVVVAGVIAGALTTEDAAARLGISIAGGAAVLLAILFATKSFVDHKKSCAKAVVAPAPEQTPVQIAEKELTEAIQHVEHKRKEFDDAENAAKADLKSESLLRRRAIASNIYTAALVLEKNAKQRLKEAREAALKEATDL